jgi:octaprenyl-diphosphate synthase
MIDFIAQSNGKRIRPLILLLSAQLCDKINAKTIDYAVIIELLHTATLVHDDIVDNTLHRRNQPSVNAKYDNRIAVLLGDYLLSLAIVKGVSTQNLTILNILAELSQTLVDGELTQLIASNHSVIDEERYFNVIWKKTAILLAACTEMGALSVDATAEEINKLRLIGKNIGLSFQIKDDIFDYYEQGEIGKPTGNDIREGKITLPLIYALNHAPAEEEKAMKAIIETQNFTKENIHTLIDFAKRLKGIEYAQEKMNSLTGEAIHLVNDFPASPARAALLDLIDYMVERKK